MRLSRPFPPLFFSRFPCSTQTFHLTTYTMALVNLRPLLPGHVLICSRRCVPRLCDLTVPETTDLFLTVQLVTRMLERVYVADGFNIAIQDGVAAGQSVPHVHVHAIPRMRGDLGEDEVYERLQGREGDVGDALRAASGELEGGYQREGRFPVPEGERKDRTMEEMEAEAQMLWREMGRELGELEEGEGAGGGGPEEKL